MRLTDLWHPGALIRHRADGWTERLGEALVGPEFLPVKTRHARGVQRAFKTRTADLLARSQSGPDPVAGAVYRAALDELLERIAIFSRDARESRAADEALELNLLRVSISSVRTRFELATR